MEIDGRWQAVGQGRQWLDEDGRHVLVMLPGDQIYKLTLRYGTLVWELTSSNASKTAFVL